MPKIKADFRQLRHFNQNLRVLANDAKPVLKWGVYDGLAVAADALRASTAALNTVSDGQSIQAYRMRTPTLINATQKAGLLAGLGISPIKERGQLAVDGKAGFEGYNGIRTRRWPNGQPNIMIAASCEHGSSGMLPQPFIRRAYSTAAGRIREAMSAAAAEKIEEILNK